MTQRRFHGEETNRPSVSPGVKNLCRAILEDADDARQSGFPRRSALDLYSVMPPGPTAIRHGSGPLPSELTSFIA